MLNQLISVFTRTKPYRYVGETVPCNLCGSMERKTVGTRDRYFNPLHTALCTNCGLVATDPMPTEDEVTRYYTNDYRVHYHNITEPRQKDVERHFLRARQRFQAVERFIPKGGKVLDFGSGGGEFVSLLCEKGIDAIGLEPNEGFAEFSRQKYGIQVIDGMWPDAEIADGTFDFIAAHHVFEHLRDPLAALEQVRKWLKPGGHFYLAVPNIADERKTPFSRFHFAHIYNFTPKTLRMMATKAGFADIDYYRQDLTDVVFKRAAQPDPDWFFAPGHGAEMQRFFETHTNRNFLFSGTVVQKWADKIFPRRAVRRLGKPTHR